MQQTADKECTNALQKLNFGKTPAQDGLNIEFYNFFWTELKNLVLDSLNFALIKGELSIDQKRGVITLIPKKDKDRLELKNWRPISVLNTDYKILTKCLALRLQTVLSFIIHPDQSGYIKNRNIVDNLRLLIDIPTYCKRQKISGILFSIDFEKAFDSLNFSFLIRVLEAFNFGVEFISWVKVLYNGINSCVLNNGYFTEFFNLERGVRQGCPLSPYLFLLSVEVLGYAIRSTEQIKGIKLSDEICKLTQFADDMNCFLGDEASLRKLLILLVKFHRASGLKVNKHKSIAKYIGSLEGKQNNQINVRWEQGSISTLGIELCNTEKEMIDKNVRPKVKAMKSLLNVWSQRGLSLKGKITVINSLVIPKIIYVQVLYLYQLKLFITLKKCWLTLYGRAGDQKLKIVL